MNMTDETAAPLVGVVDTMNTELVDCKMVSLRPHRLLRASVHVRLYYVLAALFLQAAMLLLTKSWASLALLGCTILAALLAETVEIPARGYRSFSWLQALRLGLVVGLLLPAGYPPAAAFVVTLAAALVCQRLLGDGADCWVNPAALAVAVCWLTGMGLFPSYSLTEALLQERNAALALMRNGTFARQPFDSAITAFLNRYLYGRLGVSIPDGYVSLLWDSGSAVPAFRFNVLTLLSSAVLAAAGVVGLLVPALHLAVYMLLVRFVAPLFYGGVAGQGDMLLALLTSGTLFGALFLLQWGGTVPLTAGGKVCYGVVAGVLAFLIIGAGGSPSGLVFTVLALNVISPLIQGIETLRGDRYVRDVLMPRVEALQKDTVDA